MRYQALNTSLSELTKASENCATASEQVHALGSAVNVIREIIKVLSPNSHSLKSSEDMLEDIIPNTKISTNSKVESWFCSHPIYPSDRAALYIFENNLCEIKFYWLNENSTKARISAGVMISPNWEDRDSTHNDSYKVGIDFFLKKDCKSLLMVISDHGNLRVMEFGDHLTHTQVEILEKIEGCLDGDSKSMLHSTLWDSMALSEVNRHFYEGVAHHFSILYQHLISCGREHEDAKLFASRLIGRLLFIWFLRKKGAIPHDEKYFPEHISDSTEYYNGILRDLFFATFNTPVYARKNNDRETPYLNGGLFDAHENDWPFDHVSFPQNFFNDLFSHLNKYNFTTDESSPEYEQVAIDPEMLGRVFESLLAEQKTETGDQARKAKGAFYTPREIVSYMCKESLRQYLYDELGDEKYHDGVDKLLDQPDYEWEAAHNNAKTYLWPFEDTNKIIPRVIGILDSLTVLDPACGSGAFPMGMLQLLTKVYERLDNRFDQYKTKLNIIQNNIFGVDIEPMAVEISRLRAWLAIIVDDRGEIDPLPNLEFKFVCADSLIPLERSMGLWSDTGLQDKMSEIRSKYFNARKPEMKESWKQEYYKLTSHQSLIYDKRESQLRSFDPFKNKRAATFFDSEYMFGVKHFNVIIGNPPYVHLEKMKDVAAVKYVPLHYKTYDPRGDLYSLFFERFIDSLQENGILVYITSNKWMRAGYGEKLRNYFSNNCQPVLLIDLGGGIFESATVDTDVIVLKKQKYSNATKAVSANSDFSTRDIRSFVNENSIDIHFNPGDNWVIVPKIEQDIKSKIEHFGVPLKDWDLKINRGLLTGCNEAFVIDNDTRDKLCSEAPNSSDIIRPVLRGRDIRNGSYTPSGLNIILSHNGYKNKDTGLYVARVNINNYPAIKEWLDSEEWNKHPEKGSSAKRLMSRTDKGDTPYNLRDCAYMDDFEHKKIVFPAIMSGGPSFAIDDNHSVLIAPGNMITSKTVNLDKLLIVLCSVGYWALRKFYMGGGIEGELKVNRLQALPVPPNIDSITREDDVYALYGFTDEESAYIKESLKQYS